MDWERGEEYPVPPRSCLNRFTPFCDRIIKQPAYCCNEGRGFLDFLFTLQQPNTLSAAVTLSGYSQLTRAQPAQALINSFSAVIYTVNKLN